MSRCARALAMLTSHEIEIRVRYQETSASGNLSVATANSLIENLVDSKLVQALDSQRPWLPVALLPLPALPKFP